MMQIEINLTKLERGTHVGRVKVTRSGKTFWRKQRVGRKEAEKKNIPMVLNNVESVKTLEQLGIRGGINDSFIVKFKDKALAIYKVIDKWRAVGEIGAYKASEIIGWDIVPETVDCDFGRGYGSSQRWIEEAKEPYDYGDEAEKEDPNYIMVEKKHLNDLSKIFLFDLLLGNSDRRSPNTIIKNDKCYAIDNELWGRHRDAITDMKALEDQCNGIKNRESNMLNFLNVNFEDDKIEKFELFKSNVIKNMKSIIINGDEIINIFKQYKMYEGIECMENNLSDIKKYYEEIK